MLLRNIQLDPSTFTDAQMDYHVQLTRAVYLFNQCSNTHVKLRNSHELVSKRGKKHTISTRLYSIFGPDDPDHDACTVEVMASDISGVRFLELNLFDNVFRLAEFYRPSHNISVKDVEFIIAANGIFDYPRPYSDSRIDKKQLMGEIYDFIGDYAS